MIDVREKGLKRNLYLRPRKDADLLEVVVEAGLADGTGGDYSHFIRELVRDGLRYREMLKSGMLHGGFRLPPYEEEKKEPTMEEKYGSLVDEGMMEEGRV